MTRETSHSVEGHPHSHPHRRNGSESDVAASLWEEVPFPRLPWDAPKELEDHIVEIENPKRVYAIHRASRRHNFQLLVERYVSQLRYGCDSTECATATCFSFRKRLAGKAPIRRYNSTSARTLASYLASQDNPDAGLCPLLSLSKPTPTALNSLLFAPKRPPLSPEHHHHHHRHHHHHNQRDSTPPDTKTKTLQDQKQVPPKEKELQSSTTKQPRQDADLDSNDRRKRRDQPRRPESPAFTIHERPTNKDYRSFAANVFGTVAFRMIEWLTPSGVAAMTEMANDYQDKREREEAAAIPSEEEMKSEASEAFDFDAFLHGEGQGGKDQDEKVAEAKEKEVESPSFLETSTPAPVTAEPPTPTPAPAAIPTALSLEHPRDPVNILAPTWTPPRTERPVAPRRNSNARVRATSSTNPKRQLSIDAFPQHPEEPLAAIRSPRHAPSSQPEKAPKPFMTTTPSLTRTLSQTFARPASPDSLATSTDKTNVTPVKEGTSWPSPKASDAPQTASHSESTLDTPDAASDTGYDELPQCLSTLNLEIVDLLCDILQEDGTTEQHFLEPSSIRRKRRQNKQGPKRMKRKSSQSRRAYPAAMKAQWKMFIEQSLFNVLSDPYAVVSAFTSENGLLDSHSLWYCMLRITRVAPTLAFDSLWMAASSLFAPQKRLTTMRSPTAKFFRVSERSLSSEEASRLMAVCFHALIAAAPLLTNTSYMFDVSRLRSYGLTTDNTGLSSRELTAVYLQYDDTFSDELALRLARRLFLAISTRRGFNEIIESELDVDTDSPETDILEALLSQLDSITEDLVHPSSVVFSHAEREVHEKRVPTLLLDWARTVMLREWDGKPEVTVTSPFGGALALTEAMFRKRASFHIGDVDFRSDYFADRLDSVDMPILWLAHTSTREKRHLLDYPFIFSPATLVSYFRSINFSRMNRSYEESSSLLNRMRHIMQSGSLISNEAHKHLLSDMLKTASCQYLILDIRRKDPLEDAFNQLWRREQRELLRPLKVHLGEDSGEEGFDSGGVQQEFFRLAIAQALDPAYGLFTVDDRTRMAWFKPGGVGEEWKYELVGLLFSLAVYNGLTLPVTFPKALYRKLLGEPVTEIHHIADGWPDLANGLTTLLDWDEGDGLVEDVFARTYEFSVESFGVHVSRQMSADNTKAQSRVQDMTEDEAAAFTIAIARSTKEDEEDEDTRLGPSASTSPSPSSASGGATMLCSAMAGRSTRSQKWPQWSNTSMGPPTVGNPEDAPMVTEENRNAYVSDYIRYLTGVSVAPQYSAFERGFRTVLHNKSLSILTSRLLQNLVEGLQTVEVSELRRYARYVGWDPSHRTIKDFWAIVKKYDEPMKRKLLEFVTASDRVPVGGLKNLQFVIQKNGVQDEGGHLPTAYTCYGTLLLPEYTSKEVLKERMGMALENAQGFGFA